MYDLVIVGNAVTARFGVNTARNQTGKCGGIFELCRVQQMRVSEPGVEIERSGWVTR